MTSTHDIDTPVLVVGGSLVGLSAAVFLAWRGVPTVVVEKHAGSAAHPRAIGYTTRTLELFRAVGLDSAIPVIPGDSKPPGRARVESLAGQRITEYPWTPPTDRPRLEYSLSKAIAVAQDRLEPLLRAKALELGADLRPGTTLLGLAQDVDGVTATVRRADGQEYRIRARYVIAADGARSPIRESLGIGRDGRGLLSVQRSVLFRADLDEYLRDGIVQFEIDQPDLQAFLTTYSDGRWVLMAPGDYDREESEWRGLIEKAIGRTDLDIEILTTGRWELAALIADRFSDGRVFLAGDAAHQLPPNRGGYGANTGIEDAHNLAWKLAEVLAGRSDPSLLGTYDAERRPIALLRHEQIFARADYKAHLTTDAPAAEVIDDDAMELGQLYRSAAVLGAGPELPRAQRPEQWAGQPGTRAPHVRVRAGDREISTLDLFQRGWVLLSEDADWSTTAAAAADKLGLEVTFVHIGVDAEPVDPQAFRDFYGIGANGATLVRPDGYIAWRTTDRPADAAGVFVAALAEVSAAVS
ncbi:2-polyprenyl-6-methoxyphenol hydroxylase-like FAD-dependent oxidoreductase [Nocardia transvalensis]|uniref:2-polyprenyl-6-methoxyphenol hydroxylase-like FAD-dependent oxidoreductase n=1 Tax=Nocardia transvalensis TaxID=37333 RepID=A0A7W9UJ47_9NOCA|nr:FAD-dependent monooxygenase [Nocardia transvalensis]MBB5915094.1 2-polyprenyl-6-methoxyphenol hydroxylase-like FAD-dependent oxidoreductase [Nocardia transvalensis]